jgi:hypothetical protein
MAIVKTPDRVYNLGEKGLPSLGQPVVSWPWGGTPHLTSWSVDALKYPLGTIIHDVVDGHPVIAQIQTHDTYGAHPEWGIKLHKGTSVFVPVDDSTGKAMRDAPDGWGVSDMAGERSARHEVQHERRWEDDHQDPFVVGSKYMARPGGAAAPAASQQLQSFRGRPMAHQDWKDHYSKIPKLAVLAGTTVLGFFAAGPFGAVAGLAAGLGIDREVRGGDWLPSFHGEREDHERQWRERFAREDQRAKRERRPGPPEQYRMQPPPPEANNSWERWQQIHPQQPGLLGQLLPGTSYQDYMNWWHQYGQNGASINGEGSWKVKRYDPTTGAFYYVGAVSAGSEGEAIDEATKNLFSASAAKPYSLPGFTNVYITSAGDVFRLGMES